MDVICHHVDKLDSFRAFVVGGKNPKVEHCTEKVVCKFIIDHEHGNTDDYYITCVALDNSDLSVNLLKFDR